MAMSNEVRKAMVLAAGEGTRVRPLTLETPKVLLPVGGIPLIEHILAWLKSHDISQVAINLHHLGGKIKNFLGDGSCFGIKLFYSPEITLLGTAGGVKKMESFFDGTFVVVCGDVLTNFDLSAMIRFHQAKKSWATLALIEMPNPAEVGIVKTNEEGRILSFVEKPSPGAELGNLGSGGVYVLEEKVLTYIPKDGFSDFAYDIFPKFMELGLPVYGYVLSPHDYLVDIGTWDKYHEVNKSIRTGRLQLLSI